MSEEQKTELSEEEQLILAQIVVDTRAFDDWFQSNINGLMVTAKSMGLDAKIKEIMRMAWRKCCEYKNQEIGQTKEQIEELKKEIADQHEKYDALHLELQRVTNRLITSEKNSRK